MKRKVEYFNMMYCEWRHVWGFMAAHNGKIIEAYEDRIAVEYFVEDKSHV